MFHKRVTKLTEKAAQAVAEGTRKLKRKVSTGSQEPSKAKKSKDIPSENTRSTSEESTLHTPASRVTSRRATVQTEEEDSLSLGDAIRVVTVIDSDTSSDTSVEAPASDAEVSDAELSKSFIPIQCHYVDQLIERLQKGWTSPVYAFFEPTPSIEYVNGRRSHVFKCMGKGCKQRVRRYLNKGDAKSTSNMAKHAKSCWGPEAYEAAQDAKSAGAAREGVIEGLLGSGTITSSFERKSKGKVTYSHKQHTKTETK